MCERKVERSTADGRRRWQAWATSTFAFWEKEEVEALLRRVPDDNLGRIERRMPLAAAMTGTRQSELLARRWRDVDWPASHVCIRPQLYARHADLQPLRKG